MIDIHCHLLPEIDDGAVDIDQSIQLARYAVADGITHMVVTPHIQPGVFDNNTSTIAAAFQLFVIALRENNIKLTVAMAAEVRLCPEVLPLVKDEKFPLFISPEGKKTILLELPHSHIPPGTEQFIQWLQSNKIAVLIAHPERNKEVMRNCNRIRTFVDMGCKLQLTAASVAGRFGEPSRITSEFMLQQGWVSVLATDAHNLKARPPRLSDGLFEASNILGRDKAHRLVYDNPWDIVGGMFVHG